MSAHVLLNLLNELRKSDKMLGLPSILSLFCNIFNKFNNARARMLDSTCHMTLKITFISHFRRENVKILPSLKQSYNGWLVGFVALRPKSTAMVIAGRPVHLTTLFPGQAWTSG